MSDEEKEAIKDVRAYIEWVKDRGTDTDKSIEILLNLIDKLQKENKEYKTASNFSEAQVEYIRKYYVDKDKIKDKIKKYYKKQTNNDVLTALEDLLKEE